MCGVSEQDQPDEIVVIVGRVMDVPTLDDDAITTVWGIRDMVPPDTYIGHRAGGLATRMGWAPDDDHPTLPCWVIVAVETGREAVAAIPYDGRWYRIPAEDLPWFMAATAGGIRASLEAGEPVHFKTSVDPRLLGLVKDGDTPPTDQHGRI